MTIVYCIPHLRNHAGMERVLSIKANRLAESGHKVSIVTTDHPAGMPSAFGLHPSISLHHLELRYEDHYGEPLIRKYIHHKRKQHAYRAELTRILKHEHADVCISMGGKEIDFLGRIDAPCVKMAELHFSLNNRAFFIAGHHRGPVWRLLGHIRTRQLVRAVRRLDQLVVLTRADLRDWQATGCTHVTQIANPCPIDRTALPDPDSRRILAVGRLEYQKGYDMLIEAWQSASPQLAGWQLDILGEGSLHDTLQSEISRRGLAPTMHIRAVTSDMAREYAASAMLVMSSRFEGLPMVAIEAMTCGLPVVSFDCEQGPRELISHGQNGLLVRPGDTAALAEALVSLARDHTLRSHMSRQAIRQAGQYHPDTIMAQWTQLLTQLIEKKA